MKLTMDQFKKMDTQLMKRVLNLKYLNMILLITLMKFKIKIYLQIILMIQTQNVEIIILQLINQIF